jgi:hypothetical protein
VVKLNVKPAAVFAVVTILAILVIAEVIALADTNSFPPVICAAPVPGNINLHFVPPETWSPNQPLPPGIDETTPYAIMLKAPELTADNCVIHYEAPSPMPVQHPELKVIPKAELISEAKK